LINRRLSNFAFSLKKELTFSRHCGGGQEAKILLCKSSVLNLTLN